VEFGVEIGEYQGVVRVSRRLFQHLSSERPTPEGCVGAYYLQRTRFESITERKLRPAPVDRGRECRDHRERVALAATGGHSAAVRSSSTTALLQRSPLSYA
jgi:hypothetical protein